MKEFDISSRIREIRNSRNYSQEFVAKKLKITQQAYAQLEKKPENATLHRLKQLALVFKVDLIAMIGEDLNYVQNNFNQQGGNSATKMIIENKPSENELYERIIETKEKEIELLRQLIKKSTR